MATYTNRYKDKIIFTEISEDTVEMTGFNNEWCRYGYENDYSEAYEKYVETCNLLKEPDYNYLIDDPSSNKVRVMTLIEFIEALKNNESYYHFHKLVKSNKSKYDMVDPSGGPYINLGTDLKFFFKDGKTRIVKNIEPKNEKIIFTVSNNK